MPTLATFDLLAQVTDGVYFNPWKLGAMVVVFALWAAFAQWVDKDTIRVNTFRMLWNIIAISAGLVATALLLFVPMFLLGLLLYLVVFGSALTAYVLHRNGLVGANDKVFTPAHIQSVIQRALSGKKKKAAPDVRERVHLRTAKGDRVTIPADEGEREQYRLSQDLLFDAFWRRAALVELQPAGEATKISYLIDGVSVEREGLVRPEGDAVLTFFKRIGGLDLEERRKPQTAKIKSAMGDQQSLIVITSAGSTAGETLTLRLLGDEVKYKVSDLGFTDEQLDQIREAMHRDSGLIVMTAPPGQGLTTSLYSMTRSNDAFLKNIQTMEFRKEIDIDNVTQHVFVPAGEKTFVGELQRVVRSDPDIIVLPEIRDKATAVVASDAAVKKQVVYVGLPALDLFDGLKRWMKLVGDQNVVAKSLNVITHQRLVRLLCTQCREPYKPDPQMLRKINMPPDKVLHRQPEQQYDKNGNPIVCQNCHGTGYVGRSAVFDMLIVDDGMRKVMAQTGSITEIQAYAMKKGAVGLQQQALHKVFDGKTSIQEVVRVTRAAARGDAGGGSSGRGGGGKPAPRPAPRPNTTPAESAS